MANAEESYLAWRSVRSVSDLDDDQKTDALASLAALTLRSLRQDASREQIARSLRTWRDKNQPIFDRLILAALTEGLADEIDIGIDVLLAGRPPRLWNLFYRTETLQFLRQTASTLSEFQLGRLEEVILEGPGEEPTEDPEFDSRQENDRSTWHVLAKLSAAGARLSDGASKKLAAIQDQYGWKLPTDETDEYLIHSSGLTWDQPDPSLMTADRSSLAKKLVLDESFESSITWWELTRLKPTKVLSALKIAGNSGSWPRFAWQRYLVSSQGDRAEVEPHPLEGLKFLFSKAPKGTIGELVSVLSSSILEISKAIPEGTEELFWEWWNTCWLPSLEVGSPNPSQDVYSQAINHPAGVLALSLLQNPAQVAERESDGHRGVREPVLSRFDKILSCNHKNAVFAKMVLARHLSYLHYLDPKWAKTNLVPLFDWQGESPEKAWEAFLYGPQLPPDLLSALGTGLVEAIRRRQQIHGRLREPLMHLLAVLGVFEPEWTTSSEQRELIASLSDNDLVLIADRLAELIGGEPSEAERTWKEAVGPWFAKYWPKDLEKRTKAVSVALTRLVLATGDAFPLAAQVVGEFLVPCEGSWVTQDLLRRRSSLVTDFPRTTLTLLDLLFSQGSLSLGALERADLRELLPIILDSDPQFANDPSYRRLRELSAAG